MSRQRSWFRSLLSLAIALGLTWFCLRTFTRVEVTPVPGTTPVENAPKIRRTAAAAAEYWVEAKLVDPKEYKLGHWLALEFPIGSPGSRDCKRLLMKEAGTLYAKLIPSPLKAATASGPVTVWTAETCALSASRNGLWVRGDIMPSKWLFRASLNYGIERYFVITQPPPRKAKDDRALARVAQDEAGRLRLLELAPFAIVSPRKEAR